MKGPPPYLSGVRVLPDRIPPDGGWPFSLPFVAQLNLELSSAVTFFVGEDGSGKSTLLEAIAVQNLERYWRHLKKAPN